MEGKAVFHDQRSNAAVFIDYENVHRTLLARHTNILRLAFFEKLRKWCSERQRRVVRIVVYCNFDMTDLYESYHQSTLQSYGVETVHTSNQGKNYADLKITIDVLTSMYSNHNIDEFFIMSNDKDMTPLLNTIRENKRSVSVITTGDTYNLSMCEFADAHITLEEICETSIDQRIIDSIAKNYWNNFTAYVDRQISDYPGKNKYTHIELIYVLSNEIKYSKIMNYELATMIKDFYDNEDIFFYNYYYYGKAYAAFAPVRRKDELIALKIINEADILPSYDLQTVIGELYENASKGNY
ncbi:MAG: NYN domain-containing protein [Christensenellales bacterium]|jgi:uncharacterized LabA/DUF88 family protein